MIEKPRPVSEIYQPDDPTHVLEDVPITDHYKTWGYSIGYVVDKVGNPTPEGGNTAVWRFAPKSMSEPVYTSNRQQGETFSMVVVDGNGLLVRCSSNGEVDKLPLSKGSTLVIGSKEAFSIINTDDTTDLLIHDIAMPAYRAGDDVELTSSLIPTDTPTPKDGYGVCVVKSLSGETIKVELPDAFFEELSTVMKES